ncbi:hypothetical protein IW262DRAFT_1294111 [Armillaria fumosa]|nr:hypothetical protein IW262DRAFT_1294111 [Armillaria fumosa]
MDLVHLFISPFEEDVLWKRIRDHLSPTLVRAGAAARSAMDLWTLEQVFEAGKHVLKGPGAVYNDLFNPAVVQVNPIKKEPGLSSKPGIVSVKQEPTVNKSLALSEELTSYLASMADSNRIMTTMLEKQIKGQRKWDEEMQRTLAQLKTTSSITLPAEEEHSFNYLRMLMEQIAQQTTYLALESQYLEGPQWDSMVKTHSQCSREASQSNDPSQDTQQDTQDFYNGSMKAGIRSNKMFHWRTYETKTKEWKVRTGEPVIVGPGNDEYSIPENLYGLVPDVNKARNKVLVLPGEVKKPSPAYRKTVEVQSGNLKQDVWNQMMKVPVTLSAEHWLATSPSMHSKMKSYVTPKRVLTKQMIVNDVTSQESEVETEDQQWDPEPLPPIEDGVSHLEGCIHINELPAVQFYVTTMQ